MLKDANPPAYRGQILSWKMPRYQEQAAPSSSSSPPPPPPPENTLARPVSTIVRKKGDREERGRRFLCQIFPTIVKIVRAMRVRVNETEISETASKIMHSEQRRQHSERILQSFPGPMNTDSSPLSVILHSATATAVKVGDGQV